MQRFCRTDTPSDLRGVIGIGRTFNPLTPIVAMGTATTKHPVPDRVKPVICNFRHPGTLTLRSERRREMNKWKKWRLNPVWLIEYGFTSALTRSGTGCFIAVPIWQQWASKGSAGPAVFRYHTNCRTRTIVHSNDHPVFLGPVTLHFDAKQRGVWNILPARAAAKLYATLTVSGRVFVSVCRQLRREISETKPLRGFLSNRAPIEKCLWLVD